MRKTMISHSISYFYLVVFLTLVMNKNVLAKSNLDKSEKFMLVKTPDIQNIPDYLLVEKPGGKQSLIKVEGEREDDQLIANRNKNRTGIQFFML